VSRTVELPKGKLLEVVLDRSELTVRFYDNGIEIKTNHYFAFKAHDEKEDWYLITNMFSPYPKFGLGRVALELFTEEMNAILYVRAFDCPEMSDGSNILPEARGFVRKMIGEGLIEDNSEQDDDL